MNEDYTVLEEGTINSKYLDLPNSSNYKTVNSLRFMYGYDKQATYDNLSFDEESVRAKSMLRLIPSISTNEHTTAFQKSVELNNIIYCWVYQIIFIFLSFTAGIILSVLGGILVAFGEFLSQFVGKTGLRLIRMFADLWIIFFQSIADILRPILALIFPWNKN